MPHKWWEEALSCYSKPGKKKDATFQSELTSMNLTQFCWHSSMNNVVVALMNRRRCLLRKSKAFLSNHFQVCTTLLIKKWERKINGKGHDYFWWARPHLLAAKCLLRTLSKFELDNKDIICSLSNYEDWPLLHGNDSCDSLVQGIQA